MIAKSIVVSKQKNLRTLILRYQRNHPEIDFLSELDTITNALASIPNKSTISSIMGLEGTVEFSSEIGISLNFTAERAENAEVLEKPSMNWNALKLCALCDLRVDKSLVF